MSFLPQRNANTQGTGSEVWVRITAFLSSRSRNTQTTYGSILREWCEFLGAPAGTPESALLMVSASEVTGAQYRLWLERRIGQAPRYTESASSDTRIGTLPPTIIKVQRRRRDGTQSTLANATIAKKFSALRRIYRMLIGSNLGVLINPFDVDRLPPPSVRSGQKRPTEMVDFSKVTEVLALPDENTPKGLRDKAILSLLFGAGMRRGEVSGIRLADLRETQTGTPFIRLRATKGKRDADQAIPPWAAVTVKKLLVHRLSEGAKSGDYLCVSYRGPQGLLATNQPISGSGIYRLFKGYCTAAGAGAFCTPHSARATAITKLLTDGVSHREVQEFSRHASVQMVEVYDKRRIGVDQNPGRKLTY